MWTCTYQVQLKPRLHAEDHDHQFICTQYLTNTVQAGRTSWNQQYGSILYCAKTGGIPSDVFGNTDL